MNTQESWEIHIAIRLDMATWYLSLLEFDDRKRIRYETAFHVAGGLEQWAEAQARRQVEIANKIVESHLVGCDVPGVMAHYVERLRAMGLSGRVRIAPTSKAEEE